MSRGGATFGDELDALDEFMRESAQRVTPTSKPAPKHSVTLAERKQIEDTLGVEVETLALVGQGMMKLSERETEAFSAFICALIAKAKTTISFEA